ncbi:MAG: flagellar biosynthesis protein FliQ [Clostridia bacterium]|nr:flagellar biosynthesis protein FliQ [Clostridia bacterium]
MSASDVLVIGREAVMTGLAIASPFLVISLLIGIIIAVFQAATQIHEQNIVFVPKIIATGIILVVLGSWIIRVMINFTENIFQHINSF